MCNTHTLFIAKMKRVVFAILLLSLIQGVSGRSHCQLNSTKGCWGHKMTFVERTGTANPFDIINVESVFSGHSTFGDIRGNDGVVEFVAGAKNGKLFYFENNVLPVQEGSCVKTALLGMVSSSENV